MAWTLLALAGLFEVVWAISLKYTEGFSRLWPSVITLALKQIPVGTGYAVWTGIGAVGTAVLGIILFQEPATAARMPAWG